MYTTNLRKVGGSVMLAVPPAVLELLDLRAGAALDLSVDQGRLMVQASRPARYRLAELLAQWDATGAADTYDQAWLNDRQTGKELL